MKLFLLIALLVALAVVGAQEPDDQYISEFEDVDSEDGGFVDGGEPLEMPDEDYDDDDDDDDDDEILPTTAYPMKRRWAGLKCMLKAKKCLMNATDCEEHLACYEDKSTCMQAAKKDRKPYMKKPSKMVCKTMFNKCIERAGSDCFKKYMCHRKKGFCYRSRGRGHGRPCRHHRRHGRRPTMGPEMLKCKTQWIQCFRKANNCSERLQCMYDFHHCMERSRPTSSPPTMSPDEDEEDMNVYRRRWNPKLVAKCKRDFKECIANSSSCPLKMRCFWRMKMCFKPKKKVMLIKITGRKPYNKFGGQWRNREMGSRYGQTGRQWGNREIGIGHRHRQTGSQWGINREMRPRHKQTGRHWGINREMRPRHKQTGRHWGNRGMGQHHRQTGRQWGKIGREMGRRIGERGRQWGNKVLKPVQKKFKNMWERKFG